MNKFLKLLLIALVAAVLPGCGSEKTNSSKTPTETAAEKAAREAAEKEAAADEVKPGLEDFFKTLLTDRKELTFTITSAGLSGGYVPDAQGVAASAPTRLVGANPITIKVGSDGKSLEAFKVAVLFQSLNLAAQAGAAGTSLTSDELKQVTFSADKKAGTLTLVLPFSHAFGSTNDGNANTGIQNALQQAKRTFVFTIGSQTGTSGKFEAIVTSEKSGGTIPQAIISGSTSFAS